MSSNYPDVAEALEKTQAWLEAELKGMRTGRPSPAMIEAIPVSCYGSVTPLQQLAAIQSPEPQLLVVQPWDPSILQDIEKAIAKSSLGVSPVVDGKLIRLPFPPMTEESRTALAKFVKEKGEQAKIRIRTGREDAIKKLRAKEKDGEVSEDDLASGEKEIQQLIDQGGKAIEALIEHKLTEVNTI